MARRQVQDELITGLELPHGVIAGGGDAAQDDVESVQGTGAPLPMKSVPYFSAVFRRQRQRRDLRASVR